MKGPLVMAALLVALELTLGLQYGVFRDELYYLACAENLSFGYVDHPPLSIAVLWAVTSLAGTALPVIRIVPALLGALLVLLAARIAQELGGGARGRTLAAAAALAAPQYLAQASYYSMNSFDLVLWAAGALLVARLAATDRPTWWLPLGAVIGLGLLNKVSMGFFAAGLVAGVLLSPLRRHLRTPWPYAGGLIAALLFAPHVVWQAANGFPTREFVANATRLKIRALSPAQFLSAQILEIHPLNLALWLPGLTWLLVARRGSRFRALGIVYVVALAIMLATRSKPYYLGPAYPVLLAAGAVAAEALLARSRSPWPFRAVVALLLTGGALTAPLAMPILPVDAFLRYQQAIGLAPQAAENNALGALPQHFADRFGWREMAAEVARVHAALPEADRAEALIVTANYGEAGALRYFGRPLGLPDAVSQHNSFYLWGPGRDDARVVITVGMSVADLRDTFESVEIAGRLTHPYAMPYETDDPILVCRGLKLPLGEAWRRGKHFI